MQVPNLTFDPIFKVMSGHYAYIPYNWFLGIKIWKQFVRNHGLSILHLTPFCDFCILLATEVVPKIFPNLNVVAHLVIPAGWGSCPPRLAIFKYPLGNETILYSLKLTFQYSRCYKPQLLIFIKQKMIEITLNCLRMEMSTGHLDNWHKQGRHRKFTSGVLGSTYNSCI